MIQAGADKVAAAPPTGAARMHFGASLYFAKALLAC